MAKNTTIFDEILAEAKINDIKGRTAKALKWFANRAKEFRGNRKRLFNDETRLKQRQLPGIMYFFRYDPKHKKTLPYYDEFPLIFPLSAKSKSFLGINFHYLPPKTRALLLKKLESIATDKRYDEKTRLRISYDVLNSTKRFKEFRPTIKRYLKSHIRSPFVKVSSFEWEIAIFLPVQQFRKASVQKVWSDSKKMINSS